LPAKQATKNISYRKAFMELTLWEVAQRLEQSPVTTADVLAKAAVQCSENGHYQIDAEMIADIKETLAFARIAACRRG
jgi:putative N-acetylmannosamine-6-phosphate epimerase